MRKNNIAELFRHHAFPSRLTPAYIRLALLLNGADFPQRDKNEPLRYLELGEGQGQRINIHAATLPEWEYWGIGDSPQDVVAARQAAATAGLDGHIPDISLETLACQGLLSDLPQFDIIAIDSAWSRTDETGRQQLLAIINACLKTGGIVCVGYSAMPGCVPLVPVRDLMLKQVTFGGAEEENTLQALKALDFADIYAQTDAAFFSAIPNARSCLESIKNTPFAQLKKNWLNPDWTPFYFADFAESLGSIRCRFAASLNLHTQLDMCLPEGVVPLLHAEEDTVMRETIRDFGLNQLTRLDIFARGLHTPSAEAISTQLESMPFCLTGPLDSMTAVVLPSSAGELVFDDDLYMMFLQVLAEEDYRPKTLAELKKHDQLKKLDHSLFLAVINILVAAGLVFPATRQATPESEKACARLNRLFCENSRHGKPQPALASPVLGSGIALSWIWQLFLLAHADGATDPLSCAKAVFGLLAGQNAAPFRNREGNPPGKAESPSLLEADAALFFESGLPWLKAMKVLPDSSPSSD